MTTSILGTGPITLARAALARALRTVAQTAVALIGTAQFVEAVDWRVVASASLLAGLVSVLTSVASNPPETGTVLGVVRETEHLVDAAVDRNAPHGENPELIEDGDER